MCYLSDGEENIVIRLWGWETTPFLKGDNMGITDSLISMFTGTDQRPRSWMMGPKGSAMRKVGDVVTMRRMMQEAAAREDWDEADRLQKMIDEMEGKSDVIEPKGGNI